MRKLCAIREIKQLLPIVNADKIELAVVDGWQVVVKKDEFKIGDKCVYCEIDSVLPDKPEFEFLRTKKFRIKTMKMRGVLSQGICFTLDILPAGVYKIGDDVTDILGVTKYLTDTEKEDIVVVKRNKIPSFLQPLLKYRVFRTFLPKKEYKGFPTFISKTDEDRIQNRMSLFEQDYKYVVREKIDGSSMTVVVRRKKSWFKTKYETMVCSRNIRKLDKNNSFWKAVERFHIDKTLESLCKEYSVEWICLQGELLDTKIQGNRYGVKDVQFYAFNLILPNGKVDCIVAERIISRYGIGWCPLIAQGHTLTNLDDTLKMAEGKSELNKAVEREGLVFRDYTNGISFKAISNRFLLGEK